MLLTDTDQKLARMSLHWVLHEMYSPEWRPVLGNNARLAMDTLLARLDMLGRVDSPVEMSADELPHLRIAVESFCRALWSIRREFEIITGLHTSDGESLLLRLGSQLTSAFHLYGCRIDLK